MSQTLQIALIPLLPLAGFILLGIFGRNYIKKSAGIIGTLLLLGAAILAIYTAYDYFFVHGKVDGVYKPIIVFDHTWLSFSKNVTPLLKSRKIDFALVFALNLNQLHKILSEVCPALHPSGKLWVAYPKATSKITSDLNRDCSWSCLVNQGFEPGDIVVLDYVWSAQRFAKNEACEYVNMEPSSNIQKYKSPAKRKLLEAVSY